MAGAAAVTALALLATACTGSGHPTAHASPAAAAKPTARATPSSTPSAPQVAITPGNGASGVNPAAGRRDRDARGRVDAVGTVARRYHHPRSGHRGANGRGRPGRGRRAGVGGGVSATRAGRGQQGQRGHGGGACHPPDRALRGSHYFRLTTPFGLGRWAALRAGSRIRSSGGTPRSSPAARRRRRAWCRCAGAPGCRPRAPARRLATAGRRRTPSTCGRARGTAA